MKPVIRVWFNHWFSTAFHLIRLLKQDEHWDFHVIGSSENPDSVVRLACDEWYCEPPFPGGEGYASFCLSFCREHGVDVFAPRRGLLHLCHHARDFEAQGVRLLLSTDYAAVSALNDKSRAYGLFSAFAPQCVPPSYSVGCAAEFAEAHWAVTAQYERACFKLAEDEGAASFRVVDDLGGAQGSLTSAPGLKLTCQAALELLERAGWEKPLLVMPYLTGPEASVDCLDTPRGPICIPRFKLGGRVEEIRFDPELLELCRTFFAYTHLAMPCNIQFKYHEGRPYLLEVNPRMSGGLQYACLAAGVNIPNLAVNQLLGRDLDWTLRTETRRLAFVETPVLL